MIKNILYTFIIILFSISISAQKSFIITGKVIDKNTKEPLPFASVFINNTTIGATTNEAGAFTLNLSNSLPNIKLSASYVGYFSTEKVIDSETVLVELEPDNQVLNEIKVSSKKDKEWIKNYKNFERIFLGETDAAKYCKIIRPWEIDFKQNKQTLTAQTLSPIEIENKYLGYKVFWYLSSFETSPKGFSMTGKARFEFLNPKNETESKTCNNNRIEAFKGSLQHFLKSLYKGTTIYDGYKIYQLTAMGKGKSRNSNFGNELNIKKTVENLSPASLIICQNKNCFINLKNQIEVHYAGKLENKPIYYDIPTQVSWLEGADNMVAFDSMGILKKPNTIVTSGSMSAGGIAEILPTNFEYSGSIDANIKRKFWQENVILLTNKAFYHPKERIWIKANMIYENYFFQDSLSKILHVDLISPQKTIIISQKWEILMVKQMGIYCCQIHCKLGIIICEPIPITCVTLVIAQFSTKKKLF
jgi:CarboxypepD_reg-like domain